eukprot:CAMPEP_0171176276 /NCGR_PEP_ID=MMETSP0790-20130122/11653_1 /TAXON_ID=2925 /ORGANISM="Alexandrium catenella, Strain OF101" /LENGTH=553 /DNA_ID=CAMNT_0011641163 /DNA_START=47 /DNA_END=1706 /DNA_ORIENTATION=-
MSDDAELLVGASRTPRVPVHATGLRPFVLGAMFGVAATCLAGAFKTFGQTPMSLNYGAATDELQSLSALADADGRRPVFLNLDLGMGSVRVPWQLTVDGGTPVNASFSSSPSLELPQISCKQIIARSVLCAGCVPNDVDDSQVLAWALNLRTAGDPRINLVGVSQTFGNADFASASHSLKRLMSEKGWALEVADLFETWTTRVGGNVFHVNFPSGSSASAVIDFAVPYRKYVNVDDRLDLLETNIEYAGQACLTSGVTHMYRQIMKSAHPVNLVATGPLSDVSCLIRNYRGPKLFAKIRAVYLLGGRRWGQGIHLCNEGADKCQPGLSDFNIRLNPVAVKTLLEAGLPAEKVVIVPFELSGRYDTSVSALDMVELGSAKHCNETSRTFLMTNMVLRAEWYHRVLGMGERVWLWDLIPFYLALEPSAFKCHEAKAALVWCESKAGFSRFHGPSRSDGGENSCVDHAVIGDGSGKKPFPSMAAEAAQLWLCTDKDDDCATPKVEAAPVTVCDEWSSESAKQKFLKEALEYAFFEDGAAAPPGAPLAHPVALPLAA